MHDSFGMKIFELRKKTELSNLSISSGRLSGKDAMENLDSMRRFIRPWLGIVTADWSLRTGSQDTVQITFSNPVSSLLSFVAIYWCLLSPIFFLFAFRYGYEPISVTGSA